MLKGEQNPNKKDCLKKGARDKSNWRYKWRVYNNKIYCKIVSKRGWNHKDNNNEKRFGANYYVEQVNNSIAVL